MYTKVTWRIGDLPKGIDSTITYVAGIPLQANEPFSGTTPTPESLDQASNLDNNTGASTREQANGGELGLTNTAVVTGTYTGEHITGTGNLPVTDEDSLTVTAEDVRLVKSVDPKEFASGGVATFTLAVDVSEYVDASAVLVTDTLPDGYCPLGGDQNYAPGAPAECAPAGGATPTPPYDSVVFDSGTGSYAITFEALNLIGANGSATPPVTFQARMRSVYSGSSRAGAATSAGDEFVNRASLSATTTAIEGTDPLPNGDDNGPLDTVTDDSSATQGTASPTIDKTMKPRRETVDCATTAAPAYTNPPSRPPDQTGPSAAVTLPASDSV